ncbi:hypothetical protein GLYMA_17G099833v4 [Glycine max]|nr:hypothetical protein GLYMA_17G099833v4 [Glycine max]KAH1117742.1 hypothetical protein GYH30_046824 [Glycine max]
MSLITFSLLFSCLSSLQDLYSPKECKKRKRK